MLTTLENVSLHPKFTHNLIAHNELLNEFIELYNTKKLHHAYILNGNKGIGKASLAFFLTKLILASNGEPINLQNTSSLLNSNQVNLIENSVNNNLLIIEPDINETTGSYKNIITVDKVRTLKQFINLSSFQENLLKIVIIDAADNLNINASNAILKVLEEPETNCLFFLINHNSRSILDTIKSRCITKHLANLSREQILAIVEQKNLANQINPADFNNYLELFEGSVDNILWFFDENHQKAYNLASNIIQSKNLTNLNTLLEVVKPFNFYNFKHFINLILYQIKQKNISKTKYLHGIEYAFNKTLEQSKVFNLDHANILTSLLLNLIK